MQTQFEAWLSMQSVSSAGLTPAQNEARRCTMTPIWNATAEDARRLISTWEDKSPQEARDILSLPDVVVTNESDKALHIGKLLLLNDEIKQFNAAIAPPAPLPPPAGRISGNGQGGTGNKGSLEC